MKKLKFLFLLMIIGCSTQEQFITGQIVSVSPYVSGKDSLYRYVIKSKDTMSEVISHYNGYLKDSTYTFRVKSIPTEVPATTNPQQQRTTQGFPRTSNINF